MTIETQPTSSAFWFFGDLAIIHVTGADTGSSFCVVELTQPAGEWTPLHVHTDSHQTQYVIEGELTVYLPGRTILVAAGESITTPINVPHTECVTSSGPARVLDVNAPAGFDKFVASAGVPALERSLPSNNELPDLELLTRLAGEHHIQLLGPPGATPH